MAETKYGKYVISNPKIAERLAHHSKESEYPWKSPAEVYLDGKMALGCPVWFDINWIYGTHLPSVPGWVKTHQLQQHEILIFVDLGGEVETTTSKGKDK